jgi:hypothetical protein
MSTEQVMEETLNIMKSADHVLFWKNFINIPEMFALAVQTSHYISQHLDVYKDNYTSSIPPDTRERIAFLRLRCEELLAKNFWDEGFHIKRVNLISLYGALLLLGDKKDLKKATDLIEQTLVAYQQISFQKYHDSIFATLIIGYFALKDYENVSESFKRYKKLTSDNITNEENDITICAFYYMSQWLASGKNQYKEKYASNLERTLKNSNLKRTRQTLVEMAEYFNLPY